MDAEQIDLDKVREYGERLTPIVDMAFLLGLPETELKAEIDNLYSPIRYAYMRGRAETADKLRQQMIEAAMAGSPTAIESAIALMRDR